MMILIFRIFRVSNSLSDPFPKSIARNLVRVTHSYGSAKRIETFQGVT